MNNKKVGENALERVVRLLKKLETLLIPVPEESAYKLLLMLMADGSGYVALTDRLYTKQEILEFNTLEELEKFLSGSTLDQMLMARWSR